MSQAPISNPNGTGLAYRTAQNNTNAAISSAFSGGTEPTTSEFKSWIDTSVSPNEIKRYDGTQWVVEGYIDTSAHTFSPAGSDVARLDASQTFAKTQTWTKGGDVASTSSIVLGDGNYFDVTGTTSITSIATKGVGTVIKLHFDDVVTLTNSTTLIMPGATDYTTVAGDELEFVEYSTGNWRCTNVQSTIGSSGLVVGSVIAFGGDTLDSRLLAGDGSAISRTTYAALFAVYGTKYGVGDGSTTFNLPDFRSSVLGGSSLSGGVDYGAGLVDRTTGTNIGNLTDGGGLAAAFDGNTSQAYSISAYIGTSVSGNSNYVGKNYGTTKTFTRLIAVPPTDATAFLVGAGSTSYEVQVYNGSWATVASGTASGSNIDETFTASGTQIRVAVGGNGSNGLGVAEVSVYAAPDITVSPVIFGVVY